jgi:hypothetical protein
MTRLSREAKTLRVMIDIYCRKNHSTKDADCPSCAAIRDYALDRLKRCPFGEKKPACSRCKVHCFKPEMREQIRQVMRFSGPRMLKRHPILALRHLVDKWMRDK